jgi:DNA-binding XRE family transcriptional regulator
MRYMSKLRHPPTATNQARKASGDEPGVKLRKSERQVEMTPAQCRAARAILKLEVRDLADAANVSTSTIVRLERGDDLLARTINAVRAALQTKGVEFAADGGVKLAEKTKGRRK